MYMNMHVRQKLCIICRHQTFIQIWIQTHIHACICTYAMHAMFTDTFHSGPKKDNIQIRLPPQEWPRPLPPHPHPASAPAWVTLAPQEPAAQSRADACASLRQIAFRPCPGRGRRNWLLLREQGWATSTPAQLDNSNFAAAARVPNPSCLQYRSPV